MLKFISCNSFRWNINQNSYFKPFLGDIIFTSLPGFQKSQGNTPSHHHEATSFADHFLFTVLISTSTSESSSDSQVLLIHMIYFAFFLLFTCLCSGSSVIRSLFCFTDETVDGQTYFLNHTHTGNRQKWLFVIDTSNNWEGHGLKKNMLAIRCLRCNYDFVVVFMCRSLQNYNISSRLEEAVYT